MFFPRCFFAQLWARMRQERRFVGGWVSYNTVYVFDSASTAVVPEKTSKLRYTDSDIPGIPFSGKRSYLAQKSTLKTTAVYVYICRSGSKLPQNST